MIDSVVRENEERTNNSMDIEDLTLEEAEVVAAGVTVTEVVIGAFIVFGAAIIIL